MKLLFRNSNSLCTHHFIAYNQIFLFNMIILLLPPQWKCHSFIIQAVAKNLKVTTQLLTSCCSLWQIYCRHIFPFLNLPKSHKDKGVDNMWMFLWPKYFPLFHNIGVWYLWPLPCMLIPKLHKYFDRSEILPEPICKISQNIDGWIPNVQRLSSQFTPCDIFSIHLLLHYCFANCLFRTTLLWVNGNLRMVWCDVVYIYTS